MSAPLLAQAPEFPRSVEDTLPASTFASVQFGGLDACLSAAEQIPLGGVIALFLSNIPAETRAEHLDQWLDRAGAQVRRNLQRQGIAPADLHAFLSCPHAVGVGRPTIEGMGPSVAWVVNRGNREAEIGRLFEALEALGARHGVLDSVKSTEMYGHRVRQWKIQGGPTIHLAEVGSKLVVTNSRGYLREIAGVARGDTQSLGQSSTLQALRGRIAKGEQLASVFANTGPICAMLDPVLPYEIADWADALGLGRIAGVYAATSAHGKGGTDVIHLGMRGSENGLFKVAASRPLDFDVARSFSANTVAFGAVRVDVEGLIGAFKTFVKLLPEEAQREIHSELYDELGDAMREAGTSMHEVHGLMKAFGDQIAIGISLEKGPVPKPELLARIELDDSRPIAALLQRVEAMVADESGLTWKQRNVDGTAVRFLNVTVENQFKISPCYAVTDEALLIGSDTAALVRALRAEDPEESLAGQDDFRAVAKDAKGCFGVSHLRLFKASELGWRSVETMVFPQIDAHADEIGFDSDALPEQEELSEALGTWTMAAHVDDKGFTLVNHGTLGWGAQLAGLGTALSEVLKRASKSPPKIY
ncbi:MAG: hypothetical protein NXI31_25695 [bacterium]|nr:hypothetical protein [bacterium]